MIRHETTIENPTDPEDPFVIVSVLGELDPNETAAALWERHMGKVNDKLDELGYG